jgi:hypothetical protein
MENNLDYNCPWCDKEMQEYAPTFTDGSFTREIAYRCENPGCSGPLLTGDQAIDYTRKKLGSNWFCSFDSRRDNEKYLVGKFMPTENIFHGEVKPYWGNSWKNCFDKALKDTNNVL